LLFVHIRFAANTVVQNTAESFPIATAALTATDGRKRYAARRRATMTTRLSDKSARCLATTSPATAAAA